MQQTLQWLTLVLALQLLAVGIWGGVTVSQQHLILQALHGEVPAREPSRLPWEALGLGRDQSNGARTGAETPQAPQQGDE
jgi:hypothetical protein